MFKKIVLMTVSFLLIALLFIDIPHIIPSRLILTLWPIGHIVVFAFFGWLLLTFHPKLKQASLLHQFKLLTLSSLLVGISIELIQPFFSRTAQIEDLLFNYVGTLAVLLYKGNFKKYKVSSQVLYSALLLYLMMPTFLTAYD